MLNIPQPYLLEIISYLYPQYVSGVKNVWTFDIDITSMGYTPVLVGDQTVFLLRTAVGSGGAAQRSSAAVGLQPFGLCGGQHAAV